MKTYELVYLISQELEAKEAEIFASEISAFLQKEGGTVIKAENPSLKTLSYLIKKQGAAFQVSLEFSLAPEKLKVIEDRIRKDPKILRYLLSSAKPPASREKVKRMIKKMPLEKTAVTDEEKGEKTEKKVELKDIEDKLEEILKE